MTSTTLVKSILSGSIRKNGRCTFCAIHSVNISIVINRCGVIAECNFDSASAVRGCIVNAAFCKMPCVALKRAFTSALLTRPSANNQVKICCRLINCGPERTILLLELLVLAIGVTGMAINPVARDHRRAYRLAFDLIRKCVLMCSN